jgi:hypothetical protein
MSIWFGHRGGRPPRRLQCTRAAGAKTGPENIPGPETHIRVPAPVYRAVPVRAKNGPGEPIPRASSGSLNLRPSRVYRAATVAQKSPEATSSRARGSSDSSCKHQSIARDGDERDEPGGLSADDVPLRLVDLDEHHLDNAQVVGRNSHAYRILLIGRITHIPGSDDVAQG